MATLLSILFSLNLLLCIFNLIPLPPLDGSGAIGLLVAEDTAVRIQEVLRQPGAALIGLIVAWTLMRELFWPVLLGAIRLLYPEYSYG